MAGGGASPNKNSDAFIHLLLGSRQEDDVETEHCDEDLPVKVCEEDLTGYHDAGVVERDLFGHDGPSLANVQVIGSRRNERLTVQVVCKQIMAGQCIGANGGRSCSRRG